MSSTALTASSGVVAPHVASGRAREVAWRSTPEACVHGLSVALVAAGA